MDAGLAAGPRLLGWLVAIAVVGGPLFLLLAGQFGMHSDEASMAPPELEAEQEPMSSGSGAPESASEPAQFEKKRTVRPKVRRTVRKRKSDGTVTNKTVTVGAPPSPEADIATRSVAPMAASDERVVDERFDTVDVMFGTDRDAITTGKRLEFGANRAGKLTLGKSVVTIPKEHDRGIVERPWSISVIGITLYKQKEDPDKHFTVQKIGILDEGEFVSASNTLLAKSETYRNQAAVFVHGYNNDFDTALYRTAQMVLRYGVRWSALSL